MKYELPGLPTMVALCLIVVLICWLGIGGAAISEIKAQGFLQTVEKWQTLLGVGAALAVGYIAVKPVWRQVKIMSAQAALLLGPAIQEDLDAIDHDKEIIACLRLCDGPLRDIGAQSNSPKIEKTLISCPKSTLHLSLLEQELRCQRQMGLISATAYV